MSWPEATGSVVKLPVCESTNFQKMTRVIPQERDDFGVGFVDLLNGESNFTTRWRRIRSSFQGVRRRNVLSDKSRCERGSGTCRTVWSAGTGALLAQFVQHYSHRAFEFCKDRNNKGTSPSYNTLPSLRHLKNALQFIVYANNIVPLFRYVDGLTGEGDIRPDQFEAICPSFEIANPHQEGLSMLKEFALKHWNFELKKANVLANLRCPFDLFVSFLVMERPDYDVAVVDPKRSKKKKGHDDIQREKLEEWEQFKRRKAENNNEVLRATIVEPATNDTSNDQTTTTTRGKSSEERKNDDDDNSAPPVVEEKNDDETKSELPAQQRQQQNQEAVGITAEEPVHHAVEGNLSLPPPKANPPCKPDQLQLPPFDLVTVQTSDSGASEVLIR